MPYHLLDVYLRLPVFALVAARLAGLLLFQPIFASLSVPARFRALLVLGLAILIAPLVPLPARPPDTAAEIALALGSELVLGAALGLVTAALLVGMQMGGMLVAQEAGLNFGQIADPTSGEDITVVSLLYMQLASLVFLLAGGHRIVLAACLDTFATIPLPGATDRAAFSLDLAVDALAVSTRLAIQVAAPILITMMLVNVALGFISRTVPQFNVLSVGFAVKTIVSFVLMALGLPALLEAFTIALEELLALLHGMTGR